MSLWANGGRRNESDFFADVERDLRLLRDHVKTYGMVNR